jgi:hypothetical protein
MLCSDGGTSMEGFLVKKLTGFNPTLMISAGMTYKIQNAPLAQSSRSFLVDEV